MARKSLPKYLKLKRDLLRKIKSARAGDRVESEHELVARHSLSRATVSRAINELVAEGYLYREQGRGTFVASVAGRPDGALGFIYYTWGGGISRSDYFGSILRGVEAAAREAGRDILFMPGKTAPGEELQPPSPAELARKGLAGVLAVGIDSDDHLADLLASGLPVVSVDYHSERLEMDAAVGGAEEGGFQGTRYLLDRGHKRVAFLGHSRHGSRAYLAPDQGSLERLAGYRRAHSAAGLNVEDELVFQPRQQETGCMDHLAGLLAAGRPPTAVFGTSLGHFEDVFAWAREKGLEIEAVSSDTLPAADRDRPPAMRACEAPVEIGRTAARLLLERIAGFTGPARRVSVPSKLIDVTKEGSG